MNIPHPGEFFASLFADSRQAEPGEITIGPRDGTGPEMSLDVGGKPEIEASL